MKEKPQVTLAKQKPQTNPFPHAPGVYAGQAIDEQTPPCANHALLDDVHRVIKIKLGQSEDGKKKIQSNRSRNSSPHASYYGPL